MDGSDTLKLVRELGTSVAASGAQTALCLAGLAGVASLHPLAAVVSCAMGGALVAGHARQAWADPLGRDKAERKAMAGGFRMRFGHEMRTGRPVEFGYADLCRHTLVLGECGSAKTEFLLGLCEQAVSTGSGVMIQDGKGDVSLFAKAFAMARRHGREDELLVLNLMTGNADLGRAGGHLLSNTMNPLANATPEGMVAILSRLVDAVGPDGPELRGRATALFTGLMPALAWMRDEAGQPLDFGTVRDHLRLECLVGLARGSAHPGMPQRIRGRIDAYLAGLPGYNSERGERQHPNTQAAHELVRKPYGRTLGTFVDVYGHIFRTEKPDIDLRDVIEGRRILVVMLPALEKSGDELADLGRVALAAFMSAMHPADGPPRPRSDEDRERPPFLAVLDEVGYYAVDGFALAAAQAGREGFAVVYGAQDTAAMRRLNEKEAAAVVALSGIKCAMRSEEGALARHARPADHPWEIPSSSAAPDCSGLPAGEMVVFHRERRVHVKGVHFGPLARSFTQRLTLRANHLYGLPARLAGKGK